MRFILRDISDSIKNNFGIYMLIIISQVIGVLCLLTVFGTYASYQKKQREINIEETRIEVDFSEVNVGDVRKVICEILTHIENDIDYVYLLTGDDERMINCHFEYINGQFAISKQISKNLSPDKGRLYNESDIISGNKVIYMGGDYELGKNYNILGEKYEVIGCSGMEFEERAAWMWIEQCPDDLFADLVIFTYKELPTYDSYMQIKNKFEESFGDRALVQQFEIRDEEEIISIRTMIFMSLVVGVVIALNTGVLYGYLLRKRRKEFAVFAIIGASSSTRFSIMTTEIGIVSMATLITGLTVFYFVCEPLVTVLYDNSKSVYSGKAYILLGAIYYTCVMLIMAVSIYFINRIKIKEMLRRVSHD